MYTVSEILALIYELGLEATHLNDLENSFKMYNKTEEVVRQ